MSRWSICVGLRRAVFAIAAFVSVLGLGEGSARADGGTLYGGERFTDPDNPRSVIRVAVSCDAAERNEDRATQPGAWSLLVAGKRLGDVGRVSPSAPDDIPLDLFLVLPRDMTMLDAHDTLMEEVTQLPYWLNAMGHRRHRIHVLTYSGCAKSPVSGEGESRLIAETGTSLDMGVQSDDPIKMRGVIEAIKHDTNAGPGQVCGRRFEGAEFNGLLRDLTGMMTGTFKLGDRERGRIALIVHDGRNVEDKASLSNPEVEALTGLFDQLILLQPDIAPLVWAAQVYRSSGPAVGLAKDVFSRRVQGDLYGDCVELRGRAACNTEAAKKERARAAREVVNTVSPRTLTGTIHHRQFVTRSSLITLLSGSASIGSKRYVGRAREVDRAFVRPTGLDKLGCRLAEAGRGGLELLGGYPGQKLSCERGEGTEEEEAGSLAEIIEKHSPFAHSYTVEVCVDEQGDGLKGKTSFRFEMDGRLCVEGEQDFNRTAGSASTRMAPKAIIASVCAEEPVDTMDCASCPPETSIDYKWIALAALAGLILGALIFRRGG